MNIYLGCINICLGCIIIYLGYRLLHLLELLRSAIELGLQLGLAPKLKKKSQAEKKSPS